jgi:long-subunit acyl-CoA synthetase (AMP-forming)
VRFIVSGAAPLAKHVEEFLRVVSCAFMLQGYGNNLSFDKLSCLQPRTA